ncbi:MAG: hypothetical protein Q7J59_00020 [Elusimicrobiota bacterium]|nr:hypothetical protein [Elusimicrobiota bacterium]
MHKHQELQAPRLTTHIKTSQKILTVSLQALFLTAVSCGVLRAYYIGGYYESYCEAQRDGEYRFNISQPKHYLQMNLWADPLPYSGIYSQFSASTLEESARIKFDRGYAEKTFFEKTKLMLLYKEERHWISSPLLYLIDTGKVQRNARGIRTEMWNIGGFAGQLIASKDASEKNDEWYGNYFDTDGNSFVGRLNYSYGIFKVGSNMIQREKRYEKYDSAGAFLSDTKYGNTVNSADMSLYFGKFTLLAEAARSESDWHDTSDENRALQAEIRDFVCGPLGLNLSYFDYGRNFHVQSSKKFSGYDGNSEFGRKGFAGECLFLVPKKAVNLTYKYSAYKAEGISISNNTDLREDYNAVYSGEQNNNVWSFTELYVRMMGGINMRLGFETKSGAVDARNFLFQLDGETPLYYCGLVAKVVDIGGETYPGQKLVLAAEQKINISDRLQMFMRLADARTDSLSWRSGFFQLKYFIGYDFEMYLECGQSWPTESLYSSTSFSDNTELDFDKVVKFTMKMNF